MLKLFTRKRAIHFINPIRIYSWHRRQMIEDFPASLPPDDEIDLMTTKHEAINYRTEPMTIQQFKKASLFQWQTNIQAKSK